MTELRQPVLGAGELQEIFDSAFEPGTPGFVVEHVDGRRGRLRLLAAHAQVRPGGTISGPSMMSLADGAAWLVTMAQIGPVVLAVTSSLSIHFLRKPQPGDLVADVELLRLGRRQSVSEVRIHADLADDPVAIATVTYAIPPPE